MPKTACWVYSAVCFILIFLAGPSAAWAQISGTGALSGSVVDASGAVVPDAQVSVISEATQETRTVKTNGNGTFLVPLVPPGTYTVKIDKQGFKQALQRGVTVIVSETNTVTTHLEVGSSSESVSVQANADMLKTESNALGNVTSTEMVNELPLVSRNYTQIIALNTGVASEVQNASALGRGGAGSSGAVNGSPDFASHGGTTSDNNFKIDGVDANDIESSGNMTSGVATPNPDSIQEFKVQTGQYDASYGRNAGANVDLITKSGTNQIHGNTWEYLRNEDMDANDFFRNVVGAPRGILRQNQYGLTIGGPIIKDKLFAFASWQGTRQLNGVSSTCSANIYSPAFTNDRSAAALGALFAGQRGALESSNGPAIAANGSNINPAALAILQYKLPNGQYLVPTPQTVNTSRSFNLQGFSAFSQACSYKEDQFMGNLDYLQNAKSRFSGRFFWANDLTTQTFPQVTLGGPGAPGSPVNSSNKFRNLSLAHTYVFTPSLLNQAVFGFHSSPSNVAQTAPFQFSSVGVNAQGAANSYPVLTVLGGMTIGGNSQNQVVGEKTYVYEDTLSYTLGKQNIRVGGGYTGYNWDIVRYNFGGIVGDLSWADVLLGQSAAQNGSPFSNNYLTIDIPGEFQRQLKVGLAYGFVQDDIKMTSRLTMNLGLRYEYEGAFTDGLGRLGAFNWAAANANAPASGSLNGYVVAANSTATLPAGVARSGNASAINDNGLNTWNPRLGFAYRLPKTERMVLRGGYGIAHSRIAGQALFNELDSPPYAVERIIVGTAASASTLQNPFPANPVFPTFIPYTPTSSLSFVSFSPNIQPPMVQTYNMQLQTKLANNLVLEVGYVGQRGLHLLETVSQNQALSASASNPIRGVTTNTLTNLTERVPVLGFSPSGASYIQSEGKSWYNGLEVSLNKRFSNGVQFQAAYTFAKDMSTDLNSTSYVNGGQAYGNQDSAASRYGPDQFIRPHRFVFSYSYQIPLFTQSNAILKTALAGWSLSGVTTVQAGQRLSILNNNATNVFGITNDRAQIATGCTYGQLTTSGSIQNRLTNYFNTSCLTGAPVIGADGAGTGFGDSGVGIVSGPGQFNFDASLAKHFKLPFMGDAGGLEFRAEAFNVFNHTQFANPDNTYSDGSFGTITSVSVNPRIMQLALKLKF
jgi:hypothetical protein